MRDHERTITFAGLQLRPDSLPGQVWLQRRCVFCGRDHAGPQILAISRGEESCRHCGGTPPVFDSENRYMMAMRGYCCHACKAVYDMHILSAKGYCIICRAVTVTKVPA